MAFSEQGNPYSGLFGSARFLGSAASWLELPAEPEIRVKFGLTVLLWLRLDPMQDNAVQFLLDARGVCQLGTEADHSFLLFLQKSIHPNAGTDNTIDLSTACGGPGAWPAATVTVPAGGGGASLVSLNAVLCNGPLSSAGTCKQFKSLQANPIPEDKWTFVGFTFDKIDGRGTFFTETGPNWQFGYYDMVAGEDRPGQYFSYNTQNWLQTDGVAGPVRVGGRKYQDPAGAGEESFQGELSCLQLYEGELRPSLVRHLRSACPVMPSHNGKLAQCPPGWTRVKEECFVVSTLDRDFAGAEWDCARRTSRNHTVRLAWSEDQRALDWLASQAAQLGYSRLWLGLDGR